MPLPAFALIALQGEYDLPRQPELRAQLAAATLPELVLLDLRDVTHLDATALTEFISLKRRAPAPGIVRIVGATPRIRKTFDSTGLGKLFEFHESFGSAIVPLSLGSR